MKNTKGFTLIEVIVGFIVIAVVSVGAFEFFRHCRRFIADSELRLSATNFSRETMEGHGWDIQHSWDDGKGVTETWQADRPLPAGGDFGSLLYNEYEGAREYSVTLNASGDSNIYNIIKVKVEWEY